MEFPKLLFSKHEGYFQLDVLSAGCIFLFLLEVLQNMSTRWFSRILVEKTQRFYFGQHQRNKSTVLFCISGWLELIIIENKEFKAKCSKPLYQRTTALDSEI